MTIGAISRILAYFTVATNLAACACTGELSDLSDKQFSIYHPRDVVIYKPVGGAPPPDDKIYVYLAVQNDSRPREPMCFARYNQKKDQWASSLLGDVIPVVTVKSIGAPIVDEPEVIIGGISGKTLRPGDRFPPVLPDPEDFPYNEASFRRDFAILLRPDRNQIGTSGYLQVRITLGKASTDSEERAEIANFRIPIKSVNGFRPEIPIPEPSEPRQ